MNSGESTLSADSSLSKEGRASGNSNSSTGANNGTSVSNSVTEQERELARDAQAEYNKGDFVACYNLLGMLEALRPQDLKVTHNQIIVDYYRSSDPRKIEILRKSLNAICMPAPTHATTGAATGVEPEDVEKSVLRYNQAVILYHSRQYQAALDIVNSLFALIEPMGKISLLLDVIVIN